MKKIKKMRKGKNYTKVKLSDWCLMLFMAVLLIQCTYSLFVPVQNSISVTGIDVVVRTSMASIFGYMLSANFGKAKRGLDNKQRANTPQIIPPQTVIASTTMTETNEIGFQLTDGVGGQDVSETAQATQKIQENAMQNDVKNDSALGQIARINANHVQVIVATLIGLFCLICIIVLRNLSTAQEYSQTVTAITAQFRDFVSGAVGFLLGNPMEDKEA